MFRFLATVIARMLAVFVRLVAHVLFAFWKAAAFVRARLAVRLVLGRWRLCSSPRLLPRLLCSSS